MHNRRPVASSIHGGPSRLGIRDKSSLFELNNDVALYNLLADDPDFLDWLRYPSREIDGFEKYIGNKIKDKP